METLLSIGQWLGFYKYGPDYGYLPGTEVQFRLFIEEIHEGQFTGRIIDWNESAGDSKISSVIGFIKGNFISFVKQYENFHAVDQFGNSYESPELRGPKVEYEGNFDQDTNTFYGRWEIATIVQETNDEIVERLSRGTWRIHHQN